MIGKEVVVRSRWSRLFKIFKANFLGFIIFLACIAWLWGSVSAMTKNWELARKVEAKKREKALLELEIATLELENKYLESKEYQELSARRQHNKVFEGEIMLVMPENAIEEKLNKTITENKTGEKLSNFDQWIAFLFGWKNNTGNK